MRIEADSELKKEWLAQCCVCVEFRLQTSHRRHSLSLGLAWPGHISIQPRVLGGRPCEPKYLWADLLEKKVSRQDMAAISWEFGGMDCEDS